MIQKLRRKFVWSSVAVLTVALLLLALVINTVNWVSVYRDISDTADELALSNMGLERGKGRNRQNRHAESPYEDRYFMLVLDINGRNADMTHVSSYTEEDAWLLLEKAQATGQENGFIEDCFFRIYETEGRVSVLFLDCYSKMDAVRKLVYISLAACAASVLLSWLAMSLLSQKAIRPILENTEKQKRFITDASHELKTPLSVIGANMDVMAMDDPDNEWILSTRRQVGLMNRMVRDMVFLARADEETRTPERSGFYLSELIKDTAEPFVMMAEAGGRAFVIEAPDDMAANGDVKGIERLISVLCDNAVKYSAENDEIRLSLFRRGVYAVIETENTPAEPIEEEKLSHLFDRFYRADDARTKKSEKTGFGIGLAIAQAVAAAHSGGAKAFMQNGKLHIECRLKV